jgi:S-formylglutathione hydrolase FrmB
MVHRPSDSRLLTNLLSHEKDYTKHLNILLQHSQSSLSSFSAYASASAPPVSTTILAVAGSFAGADDALRRYMGSVEEWRGRLKDLKELEDEVGNIMRDREILYVFIWVYHNSNSQMR